MFYRQPEAGQHPGIFVLVAAEDMTEKKTDSDSRVDSQQIYAPQVASVDSFAGKVSTKTYHEKFKVWGYNVPEQPNTFKLFHLPIQLLFRFPGMVFGGIFVGGILGRSNVVGGSLALILSGSPSICT